MENLNLIIAKNLIRFRTQNNLTQLELAQKLNYSDKSISKWERGEGLPDVTVLVALSELYGVKLDDFLSEQNYVKTNKNTTVKKSRLLVSLLSTGLVLLLASICFAVLFIIESTKNIAWMSFLYSLPVCAIVLLIFSEIWGNRYLNTLFSSLIIWGIILCICLTVNINDIWIICIIGVVLNLLIIFWYVLRHITIQNKKSFKFINHLFNKGKKNNLNKQNNKKTKNKGKQELIFNNIKEENELNNQNI